ncbi:MAG: PTS glucose transporter subunit IIA [Actinomycetaceae bacterium]|nr:PTS glucose transporter subunit IIA [Actinomycetaceae bacterium]
MLEVHSPLSGTTLALANVDDPVLAQEIVGAGVAVAPVEERWHDVVAPVDGKLLKVHPHAFIVFTRSGIGILVHLGIDTIKLRGNGFEVLKSEGDTVKRGEPIVRWDSAVAKEHGLSTSVSVIACDLPRDLLVFHSSPGNGISRESLLYTVSSPS